MKSKTQRICWGVLLGSTLIFVLPGFVIGSLLYLAVSMICSVFAKSSIFDYVAMYVWTVIEFWKKITFVTKSLVTGK